MNFRTEIKQPKSNFSINHQSKLLMLGSCFTNNIGQRLIDDKFDVLLNPFGVLYNPMSIEKSLNLLIDDKYFSKEDLFEDHGVFNSFYHHSSFSSSDIDICLKNINSEFRIAAKRLKEVDTLIVTFGTSYVYEYIQTSQIVSNCHKLPATDFRRYRLAVDAIVNSWSALIDRLSRDKPNLQLIFTVSPIRHLRDGAHDNQLSKSILLLAIDDLKSKFDNVSYFPAYEIVLDDLRDYRFFDVDMTHPNALATDYIYQIFSNVYFNTGTENIINEWRKIKRSLAHKPIVDRNVVNERYAEFLKQTLLKVKTFKSKYPFICVNREVNELEEKLN